jgi:hypothetical protein
MVIYGKSYQLMPGIPAAEACPSNATLQSKILFAEKEGTIDKKNTPTLTQILRNTHIIIDHD